jgi:hypothetical protein
LSSKGEDKGRSTKLVRLPATLLRTSPFIFSLS